MAALALSAIPYFMLVSTGDIRLFLLGGHVIQACRSSVYGPRSAYFAEQFSTRMRYSGAHSPTNSPRSSEAWRR
jgi:MFS transporter, MHS family, shikimate and dehydroshikimate transport protein